MAHGRSRWKTRHARHILTAGWPEAKKRVVPTSDWLVSATGYWRTSPEMTSASLVMATNYRRYSLGFSSHASKSNTWAKAKRRMEGLPAEQGLRISSNTTLSPKKKRNMKFLPHSSLWSKSIELSGNFLIDATTKVFPLVLGHKTEDANPPHRWSYCSKSQKLCPRKVQISPKLRQSSICTLQTVWKFIMVTWWGHGHAA